MHPNRCADTLSSNTKWDLAQCAFTGKELIQLSTRLLLIKIAVKSWIRDCLTDLLAQILHPACVLDLNCRRIYMCIWNKMRWCIYLPAIQLPPRRTGSRTAFASFSAEIQPNQRNNQQKLGLPNGIKMGNQIKHGKLAYLHRGQRQRCTCGRGRLRPRSMKLRMC